MPNNKEIISRAAAAELTANTLLFLIKFPNFFQIILNTFLV